MIILQKNEKLFIGVLIGIALANIFMQYLSAKKMEEIKQQIINK